ncbi:MAG: hypothetical protein GWO08_06095, partial [Gammaproteobacteria bacterium]|nr:hypothetical protein [Gammaproteobacteria bacterium]NIT53444.1 hypothetical protein [candidate division Zixibacteria bacterium]NIW43563.1 hypothetical protein [Gammaproteobacteria bacterium]NIX58147.1 hypothetical protein [candidate division Zixibacteria bacterium]
MQEHIEKARKTSISWGIGGGLLLLSIYFIIVSLANSFAHAINEFGQLWYWIGALTIGFGIQMGLFTHIRHTIKIKKQVRGATSSVAAGAGVSTVSMVACCAHHLSDILPVLGSSAAAVFLTEYQLLFILAGVISNILGITYMLSIIARHGLYFDANRWLTRLAGLNYKRIFRIETPVFTVVFILAVLFIYPDSEVSSSVTNNQQPVILKQQEVAGNGVFVSAEGRYQLDSQVMKFTIRLNTHSGSLQYEVDKIASLFVDGRVVESQGIWKGSAPGGHHRSGFLTFRDVPPDVEKIVLELSA